MKDATLLAKLKPMADDAEFRKRWAAIKVQKKAALAARIKEVTGYEVSTSPMYDIQVGAGCWAGCWAWWVLVRAGRGGCWCVLGWGLWLVGGCRGVLAGPGSWVLPGPGWLVLDGGTRAWVVVGLAASWQMPPHPMNPPLQLHCFPLLLSFPPPPCRRSSAFMSTSGST